MGMARTYEDLRKTPDEELIREHDEIARHTQFGTNDYIEELARRRADRQTRQMLWLTCIIGLLTVVNVGLVAVTVF